MPMSHRASSQPGGLASGRTQAALLAPFAAYHAGIQGFRARAQIENTVLDGAKGYVRYSVQGYSLLTL